MEGGLQNGYDARFRPTSAQVYSAAWGVALRLQGLNDSCELKYVGLQAGTKITLRRQIIMSIQ